MRIPRKPPPEADLWTAFAGSEEGRQRWHRIMNAGISPTPGGEYLSWDKLRHLEPPHGLTHEEWWHGVKWARQFLPLKKIPLIGVDGSSFHCAVTDEIFELLSKVDREASGRQTVSEAVVTTEVRDRYVVSSLIEEAIASSQLEGAATTRLVAKEMIRSGRKPRTVDERMILNNFEAIRRIRRFSEDTLQPDMVLGIHRILTVDAIEPADACGRLRQAPERVLVRDEQNEILHKPPPADELPKRLDTMCTFANEGVPGTYIHPVMRAILLHFWLAYDHPFVDGNGRTARALFYWAMLREGYWTSEFLSISRLLRRAPAAYARSFLHPEMDGSDATYFVIAQLRVLNRAIQDLWHYVGQKEEQVRRMERQLRLVGRLNHRQRALLSHALRHPDGQYTIHSHQVSHGVVYDTARTDLLQLAKEGFLLQTKVGKAYVFHPSQELIEQVSSEA